jgi:hypothetical protein
MEWETKCVYSEAVIAGRSFHLRLEGWPPLGPEIEQGKIARGAINVLKFLRLSRKKKKG